MQIWLKKVILSFIVLYTLSYSTYAQNNISPLSIGLGGGIDLISNEDLVASPLEYNGVGLPIGLNVFAKSNNWIHNFEISVIIPFLTNNYPLKTKANTQLKSWTKINLKYSLLKNVNNNNFVGGTIKSDFFFREYNFLDGMSWDLINSIDFTYARNIKLNDKSFFLPQVSIPTIGFIHRKPSLTFDEQFLDDFHNNERTGLLKYGKWHLNFDNWFGINFDLLYQLNISKKFTFQSRTGLSFYTIKSPERITNFNIPIRCYLNYQL